MSTVFTSNAGKRISEYRKKRGVSQQQLADLIGISRSYLGDIEAGRSEPSTHFLTAITTKTDVSSDWILTGEGEMLKTKPDPTPTSSTEDRRCGISERRLTMMDELLDGLDQTQQQEILSVISEKKRINEMQRQLEQLINQQTRQSA